MTLVSQKEKALKTFSALAGAVGIEPTMMVLETTVIPFNYAPIYSANG